MISLNAHGRGPLARFVVGIVYAIAMVVALMSIDACSGASNRRTASVIIASTGGAVRAMQDAHHDIYGTATDALLARGIMGHEYELASAPIDAEFAARGEAIQALDVSLYAAAALVNATAGPTTLAAYREPAQQVLDAIARALVVLRRGAILPAVPIPNEIDQAVAALRLIAGAPL